VKKSGTCFGLLFAVALVMSILLAYEPAYAQAQSTSTDFWSNLDTAVKVVAGVVAAITAVLGVPVTFLQIRGINVKRSCLT
jgi:hypothetical protein